MIGHYRHCTGHFRPIPNGQRRTPPAKPHMECGNLFPLSPVPLPSRQCCFLRRTLLVPFTLNRSSQASVATKATVRACPPAAMVGQLQLNPEDKQEPAKHIEQEHPRLRARVSSAATTLTDPLACASSLYALPRPPYKHAAPASGSGVSGATCRVLNGPTRLRFELVRAAACLHTSTQRQQVDRAFRAPRFGSLTDPLACASSLYVLPRPPYKHAAPASGSRVSGASFPVPNGPTRLRFELVRAAASSIQARSASKWIRRFDLP